MKLYGCIKELYEQGVPFAELKALIPDIKRTREQLHMKRMLENNNEVLLSMFSKEMSLSLIHISHLVYYEFSALSRDFIGILAEHRKKIRSQSSRREI